MISFIGLFHTRRNIFLPTLFFSFIRKSFKSNEENIKKQIEILLKSIQSEGKNIVEAGLLSKIHIDDNKVKIFLNLNKNYMKIKRQIHALLIEKRHTSFPFNLDLPIEVAIAPEEKIKNPGLRNVRHLIGVSSCKGGVGKSTIAVNLAFALKNINKTVGIFDADIYGPSLPVLLKPEDIRLELSPNNPKMVSPFTFQGIKAMSFGLAFPHRRAIMRGPMVSRVVSQLIGNTEWGDLEYLIVDMPPGTGDIQLTLSQECKFTGAVIVTTPQKLSFIDVVKGIEMFDEMKIPVLSVVENMAYFKCTACSAHHSIFGRGYISMLKEQFGIEDSFQIPVDALISKCNDSGIPFFTVADETSRGIFERIAMSLNNKVGVIEDLVKSRPKVSYDAKLKAISIDYGDKKRKVVSARHLRTKCLCAGCVDESTGKKVINTSDRQIPEDVYPLRIEEKGNYAVAIIWSDGHRSSIYPYKRILSNEIESLALL